MEAEPGIVGEIWEAVFTAGPPLLSQRPRKGTLSAAAVRSALAAFDAGGDPTRFRILAGLALLWHDHWDEAHAIAQSREGERDFDLLHAILHRREGDSANAGYWFRSAGKHPCYSRLENALAERLPEGGLKEALLPRGRWSPSAFVAAAGAAGDGTGAAAEALMRVQAEEFRAFAEWLVSES